MSRKNSGRARCCQETSPGLTPAKGVTNGQGGNHTYPTDPIFALIDTERAARKAWNRCYAEAFPQNCRLEDKSG